MTGSLVVGSAFPGTRHGNVDQIGVAERRKRRFGVLELAGSEIVETKWRRVAVARDKKQRPLLAQIIDDDLARRIRADDVPAGHSRRIGCARS